MGDEPYTWFWRIPVMVLCRSNRNHVEDSAVTGVMIVSGDYLYGVLFSHELHGFFVRICYNEIAQSFSLRCVRTGEKKALCRRRDSEHVRCNRSLFENWRGKGRADWLCDDSRTPAQFVRLTDCAIPLNM